MRSMFVNLLAAYSTVATLVAGRLDVAIIQFPEEKAPAELESALAKANLSEMTNADRTRTTQPYLKGGYVLFALRATPPGLARLQLLDRYAFEERERRSRRTSRRGQNLGFHFINGGSEGRIANVSEEGLHGLGSASLRPAAPASCPADPRPIPEYHQGANKNGELSSDNRCRCAVYSLDGM
jgi:hypothetical protein